MYTRCFSLLCFFRFRNSFCSIFSANLIPYLSVLLGILSGVSIEIILNNNPFQFSEVNYIQTLGTAVGAKMALAYTILTLTYSEENLYEIIGKKIRQLSQYMYLGFQRINQKHNNRFASTLKHLCISCAPGFPQGQLL